ncbi:hypothetical protein RvY_01428-2 [Ramazzottius varieornatus]|uniref:Uncharacterized protein n=1 Tax=Ramazzottius varieornatus TaxID=947166 RepID=A0A1D1UGA0_RAMVA|nr:hypothetical protein RvY_01428-2 [Ramazzottius varieornatus]
MKCTRAMIGSLPRSSILTSGTNRITVRDKTLIGLTRSRQRSSDQLVPASHTCDQIGYTCASLDDRRSTACTSKVTQSWSRKHLRTVLVRHFGTTVSALAVWMALPAQEDTTTTSRNTDPVMVTRRSMIMATYARDTRTNGWETCITIASLSQFVRLAMFKTVRPT